MITYKFTIHFTRFPRPWLPAPSVVLPKALEGRPLRVAQRHRRAQVHAHVEGLRGVEDQADGLLHLWGIRRPNGGGTGGAQVAVGNAGFMVVEPKKTRKHNG